MKINHKRELQNIAINHSANIDYQDFKKIYRECTNSFINEFHSATNKEDKEKVVKELKDIDNIVYHYIEMDKNSESKLIDIANVPDYFLYKYSKKWGTDFNRREAVKKWYKMYVCVKWF